MALHVVRSLGQAFDICHKLNPKPAKKKEVAEGEKEKEEGEEEAEGDNEGESKSPTGVPAHWKTFNTDLDDAMDKMKLEDGESDQKEKSGADDLLGLNFDPFATPAAAGSAFAPNGSATDPFHSSSFNGSFSGNTGAVAYPPLTVSNLSTNLPDFPDGVDPATVKVPPPHMAYFAMGGKLPPGVGGGQKVREERRVSQV